MGELFSVATSASELFCKSKELFLYLNHVILSEVNRFAKRIGLRSRRIP
jgi:hypothetical protein